MDEAILKYMVIPIVAVTGIYIVGSIIYDLFGIPAILFFMAVGGVPFVAKFFRH